MATITYKCPNCDGGLIFDPSIQKYHCQFCLSDFTQEELESLKPDSAKDRTVDPETAGGTEGQGQAGAPWIVPSSQAREKGEPWTGGSQMKGEEKSAAGSGNSEAGALEDSTRAVLYTCPSCGAQIVTDDTTAATFCYYCHNPVVLSGRLSGEFAPDYVIPFQIDRKKAEEIFSQWIGRKKYVPEAFYCKKQVESMQGVYFPYWLYGCRIDGDLDAQGTRLRTWTTGNMRYTETQVYDVRRQGSMDVNHVARNGLRKANRRLVDGVLPFRLEEKKDFSMGYLSGFFAENRDMEQQEFITGIQAEVREFALGSLQAQAGSYNRLQIKKKEAMIRDERWSYALLPVWTITYNDKAGGNIYYFALNGQTGKICGNVPVDNKKLAVLFLSIFLPLCIILLIGGYFLG